MIVTMRPHAVTHAHAVPMTHLSTSTPLMPTVTSLDDGRLGGGRHRKRNSQTCDQQTNFFMALPFSSRDTSPGDARGSANARG